MAMWNTQHEWIVFESIFSIYKIGSCLHCHCDIRYNSDFVEIKYFVRVLLEQSTANLFIYLLLKKRSEAKAVWVWLWQTPLVGSAWANTMQRCIIVFVCHKQHHVRIVPVFAHAKVRSRESNLYNRLTSHCKTITCQFNKGQYIYSI